MATPGAEDVFESESWQQDELSELKDLLQRAEQRMRKSKSTSKHTVTVKAAESYKY